MRTCLRNVRWYSAPQEPTGGTIWLEDGEIAGLEVGDHPCQVDAGELSFLARHLDLLARRRSSRP